MSKGKLISQGAHGACHITEIMIREHSNEWKKYKHSGQGKIILKAPEETLHFLLKKYSQITYPIYDAGLTQIAAGSFTCLAFIPLEDKDVPIELKSLKLI